MGTKGTPYWCALISYFFSSGFLEGKVGSYRRPDPSPYLAHFLKASPIFEVHDSMKTYLNPDHNKFRLPRKQDAFQMRMTLAVWILLRNKMQSVRLPKISFEDVVSTISQHSASLRLRKSCSLLKSTINGCIRAMGEQLGLMGSQSTYGSLWVLLVHLPQTLLSPGITEGAGSLTNISLLVLTKKNVFWCYRQQFPNTVSHSLGFWNRENKIHIFHNSEYNMVEKKNKYINCETQIQTYSFILCLFLKLFLFYLVKIL